jgi:hypothetical protein
MAFFAEREKINKDDYEAFHDKCGDLIFSNGRRTAQVPILLSGGIVRSAKPIPTGGMFQVKMVERGYLNKLGIGFTSLDPDSIGRDADNVYDYVRTIRTKDYWTFWGSSALHYNTSQELSFSTCSLTDGDSVGVRASENGDVRYYVNGKIKGKVFKNLPVKHQDLWGVVFLIGGTKIQSEFHFGVQSLKGLYAAGVPSLKDLCLRSCSLLHQVCLEQLPPSLVKEVEDVRRESST